MVEVTGTTATARRGELDVLLVEDAAAVREELRAALARLRRVRSVTTAASVAEARERLGEAEFELGVLDFRLPDGTALEILEQRGGHPLPTVVAVVTSYTSSRVRAACRERGAGYFVGKSNAVTRLEAVIRRPGAPARETRRRGNRG